MGWAMNLGLAKLLGIGANGKEKEKVTVVLHLDPHLVEELKIAAESRNNISVEEYIVETISCAVSDRSCEPEPKVESLCYLCGHSMENNDHGMLEQDYNSEGEHTGQCTECHVCNP